MATIRSIRKMSPQWVRQTRKDFLKFLQATQFPSVERHGSRGQTVIYPAWLIRLVGVRAVTCPEPTSWGIHRVTGRFWNE